MTGEAILITGGTRGVGRGLGDELTRRGRQVLVTSRRPGGGALELDVTDRASVARLFEAVAAAGIRLGAVVNNAGLGFFGPFAEQSLSDVRAMLETNALGAYEVARHAVAHFDGRGGRIVNIGSIADQEAIPGNVGYAMSKWALRGLSATLQAELRGQPIAVTHVSLGAVLTEMWSDREGFDPADMLPMAEVAKVLADVTTAPPTVRIDHLTLYPPKGVL